MGADVVTIYYGIRFQVVESTELQQLRIGKHPLARLARKVGLDHYWGNFSMGGDDFYVLYVGTKLGEFGHEGLPELELSDERLGKIQRDTKKKLAQAGFSLIPALLAQFEPDL